MTNEQADVIVIGLGPGGEKVAGDLSEAGLDVVGIESNLVGGECPYWGCLPSKMMIRAASALHEARRIPGLAGESDVTPQWDAVARRIREEATDNWNDQVAVDRFEGKGGRFIRGRGRLVAPDRVAVGDAEITAGTAIVLATGTRAAIPPIPGIDTAAIWTNREFVEAEQLPESLIVLGGGAIGTELAQVAARFGTEVTIVEALDRLMPNEEPEVGEAMAEILGAEGIKVHTGSSAQMVEMSGPTTIVELGDGSRLGADRLLVATGRRTNLGGLGLHAAGLDDDARFITVDDTMRAAPSLWAVGDITGAGLFTHVAYYQADIATADILGKSPDPADYNALPRVTFTDPEVGSVGRSEGSARQEGIRVATAFKPVAHTARGWLHAAGNDGFIKLVADADRGVLVGATSMGPHGGEVLGMLALAVHARVPIAEMRSMMFAYPTFHKGVEDALNDLDI